MPDIANAYDNVSGVIISGLTADEAYTDEIELKYDFPDIAVDTSARFTSHEVIGGETIRQKLGEDPREIEVSGVCTYYNAWHIDRLKFEDTIEFNSNRTGPVTVQVASTSTSPRSEGGEINMDGDFTHTFSISLVEVI